MSENKLFNKETGFLFYGLTPPKLNAEEDKIRNIAEKQIERLRNIEIDALILYDIQDESSRTNLPRPFPFSSTQSPEYYSENYLTELKTPRIIYKSIGQFTDSEFREWIKKNSKTIDYLVFVGSPSKNQIASLSLQDAYRIKKELNASTLLGGITIPERHAKKEDEHIRVFDKIDQGCSFFISQCVYSVNNSKNFLSDYYYSAIEQNREMAPIIFTLTPCGSLKTLQFMEWLGIDIPKWLNNELKHSKDILANSIEICKTIAIELLDFSHKKNIPIGFNIESVAIRKEEIDASIELLKYIKALQNSNK